MLERIALTVSRVTTLRQDQILSHATGFFFKRDEILYLVTNRHVLCDEPTGHTPDHVTLELHDDPQNLATTILHTLPLYDGKNPLWREMSDASGPVDVVVLPINQVDWPQSSLIFPFEPEDVVLDFDSFSMGDSLSIIGFPLGFHDTLHHLPVSRQAALASAFGLRFQGGGYFLTDARMHRGASGSPVVAKTHVKTRDPGFSWVLLGVHASRFDVTRDLTADESLGLNAAWYADVLITLTDPAKEAVPASDVAAEVAPTAFDNSPPSVESTEPNASPVKVPVECG